MRQEASLAEMELAPGLRLVSLSGFLDSVAAARLETALELALAHDGSHILDLAEVEYCGSLGIRMLVSAARLAKRRGQRLVFAAPQPLVRQLLDMAAIPEIVPVTDTVEAAQAFLAA
jgi:anti-anti-sigma factor